MLFSKYSLGQLDSLLLLHGVIAKERISGWVDNSPVLGCQSEDSVSQVRVFTWFQLPYRGVELGKSSLSFKMWTGGRSFACKLQQKLNSQGLARKQSGHNWLGPGASAPTEQEPS